MTKILRLLSFFAIATIILSGCRKETPITINPSQQQISNWSDAFQGFWDGMNYNYIFWSIDPTDWDKIHSDYKPKFANLKLNVPEDDAKAIKLFEELSSTLIDHHLSITIKTNSMDNDFIIDPSKNKVKKRSYYHTTYNKELLYNAAELNEDKGRITNWTYGKQPKPSSSSYMDMLHYVIDGDIAYLTFNQFSLATLIAKKPDGPIAKTYNSFIKTINDMPNLKGIIIDVRQNGGGSTDDFGYIVGPFLKNRTLMGYSRMKNGLGRLDYAPWSPVEYTPKNVLNRSIDIPIVALADLYSISMAETSSLNIKQMPNGYLIGERTWGGFGIIDNNFDGYYSGAFDVGTNKIISVYMSTFMNIDRDRNCHEGLGIEPDIEVLLDLDAMKNGVDNQLERAISFIHNGI